MIKRESFTKVNGKWESTFIDTDPAKVYEWLAHDLIAKKLHGCKYIRQIKERCLYNGYREITVYFDDYKTPCKNVFTVKE